MRDAGAANVANRYSNMDYIFFSAIAGISLLWLTLSYDIVCQYKLHMFERMELLPARLHLDDEKTKLETALPVWHAGAHELLCQAGNSLSFVEGVGRTDGEGIERIWSGLNPLGWATKEMGPGARQDAIEDKIDHHNFEKNIGLGEWHQSCAHAFS